MAEKSIFNEPDVDFHLKLNQQLFHIPYELLSKCIKHTQAVINKETKSLHDHVNTLNEIFENNDVEHDKLALAKITELIRKTDHLEKFLNMQIKSYYEILNRIKKRLEFFHELKDIKSQTTETLHDENNQIARNKLIQWYQCYTNILIGDYLTRNNPIKYNPETNEHWNSGVVFLKQSELDDLIDYDVLLMANRISTSLLNEHDLLPLISWINENKKTLTKKSSILEFQARLQEYIELLKVDNYIDAIVCFQKFLLPFIQSNFTDLKLASGLLIFIKFCNKKKLNSCSNLGFNSEEIKSQNLPMTKDQIFQHFFHKSLPKDTSNPGMNTKNHEKNSLIIPQNGNFERYLNLLDDERWSVLNNLFLKDFYSMYGISQNDPLLIYLSLGISSLKTRDCMHPSDDNEMDKGSETTIVPENETGHLQIFTLHSLKRKNCPVCSETFKPITQVLPFAHHMQSQLFENPVLLPNGNVYDLKKLKKLAKTLKKQNLISLNSGQIMDPVDMKIFCESDSIKMYPT
ncbi:fyv10p [Saccharomyces arboricola H-6]|uniref:Fyv10p n=1 Tax=Saccharomyces arboricola (strain H-6 / AS 2.3317 / CBS 10644) TaxID=1160507 RepID=J8Q109_SACAR|nr:fyv10p [Saccharomyces arboricola H-6]